MPFGCKGYSHVFFADMAYPDLKIIIEYDGRHHASRWLADSKRREALEDEGWLYIQVTAENLGMRILKGNWRNM